MPKNKRKKLTAPMAKVASTPKLMPTTVPRTTLKKQSADVKYSFEKQIVPIPQATNGNVELLALSNGVFLQVGRAETSEIPDYYDLILNLYNKQGVITTKREVGLSRFAPPPYGYALLTDSIYLALLPQNHFFCETGIFSGLYRIVNENDKLEIIEIVTNRNIRGLIKVAMLNENEILVHYDHNIMIFTLDEFKQYLQNNYKSKAFYELNMKNLLRSQTVGASKMDYDVRVVGRNRFVTIASHAPQTPQIEAGFYVVGRWQWSAMERRRLQRIGKEEVFQGRDFKDVVGVNHEQFAVAYTSAENPSSCYIGVSDFKQDMSSVPSNANAPRPRGEITLEMANATNDFKLAALPPVNSLLNRPTLVAACNQDEKPRSRQFSLIDVNERVVRPADAGYIDGFSEVVASDNGEVSYVSTDLEGFSTTKVMTPVNLDALQRELVAATDLLPDIISQELIPFASIPGTFFGSSKSQLAKVAKDDQKDEEKVGVFTPTA